jgi:hypothetical protein
MIDSFHCGSDEFLLLRGSDVHTVGPGEEPCSLVQAFDKVSDPWDGQMPPSPPGAAKPAMLPDEEAHEGGCEAAARETSELLVQHYFDCNSTCGTIGRVATTLQMAIEA